MIRCCRLIWPYNLYIRTPHETTPLVSTVERLSFYAVAVHVGIDVDAVAAMYVGTDVDDDNDGAAEDNAVTSSTTFDTSILVTNIIPKSRLFILSEKSTGWT